MKRRICCFCETWESGGIESFLYNILSHMELDGLEVDLVVVQRKDSVFTDRLEALGVQFRELSGNKHAIKRNHAMFRALLRERNYDVVHLNIFQGLQLSYLRLAKEAGVPVRIAHSHNADLRKSKTRTLKLLLHNRAKERYTGDATALWACSSLAADFLFSQTERRKKGFRFIPNGIELERFRFQGDIRDQVRRELGVENTLVIGNVGRLCYQKNQSFLLDVFAEVTKKRPDSRLLLVGEGEDEAMLRERADFLGMSDRVIFYGTTKAVERLFWAMDIFAFPSLFEGLGIVAIEAQTAGLPVVASEFIPTETDVSSGFHRVSLEVMKWEETLLNEEIERNKNAVSAVASAGFDIQTVADRIQTVYLGG